MVKPLPRTLRPTHHHLHKSSITTTTLMPSSIFFLIFTHLNSYPETQIRNNKKHKNMTFCYWQQKHLLPLLLTSQQLPTTTTVTNTKSAVKNMTFWKRWVVIVAVAVARAATVDGSGCSLTLNMVSFYPGYFLLTPPRVALTVESYQSGFFLIIFFFNLFKLYFYYFTKGGLFLSQVSLYHSSLNIVNFFFLYK